MAVIGVDNYSFHRLLGEVRPGEIASSLPDLTWRDTIDASARLGADVVALETCFMDRGAALRDLRSQTPIPVMFSWGHPYGLEFGGNREAERDALAWLDAAATLGHDRMRIVIAHPALRPGDDGWASVRASVPALGRLAQAGTGSGVTIALENHADITAEQLRWLIDEVGSPSFAACLDFANAVRVGDDPVAAARALASSTVVAHVKDLADGPWHPQSGPTSVALGTGGVRLSDVLSALMEGGRDPWLLVEVAHLGAEQVDELARISADLSWLRSHVGTPEGRRQR